MAAHWAPPFLGFSRQEQGCHFYFQCMKVKNESEVAQLCPTFSDPHGLQPTRLLHPWNFPGKITGVGCHCLLHDYFYTTGISQILVIFLFLGKIIKQKNHMYRYLSIFKPLQSEVRNPRGSIHLQIHNCLSKL